MEISEAASFKLKLEKPSVSSSHCLSSTGAEMTGKADQLTTSKRSKRTTSSVIRDNVTVCRIVIIFTSRT